MRKLAILIAAGLLAAACSSGDDSSDGAAEAGDDAEVTGAIRDVAEEPGEPVTGGSITVGIEAETDGWLPGRSNFANAGVTVAYALYDPLMKVDAEGEIRPYLAESMEPNEDFTSWTLTLRPDITFHDGTPLNAEALKSNFDDYLTTPDSNLLGGLGGVEMEVVDDLTVTYVMPSPNSGFPYSLALAAGWPFSPTAAAAAGEDAPSRPVGTGPFVFQSWERDSRLVVTRNESYWQEGLPYLDEITFRPIPDEDTRISSLSTGDVDVMHSLRQSAITELRELDGVDNYEHLGNNTGVNIFNTTEPPLDDVRVRRGLALAIDQSQVIDVLGGAGIVPPATQIFSPDDAYFSEAVAEDWLEYDPAAATEELQAYVDDPERSDGEAPGTPVSLRYDCPPDPSLNELSQLYQALWNSVGVEVELRQVEQATHVSEALAGDYQAKCFRAGLDGDPGVVLNNAFTEGSPTNFTRFTDPAIDEALAAVRSTDDLEERRGLVEEIMSVVNENVPLTYSGQTLGVVAAKSEVRNLDGWTYPDGSAGNTAPQGTVVWANVWTTG
jgi:peptide/nickel transport system substrate-binding protein